MNKETFFEIYCRLCGSQRCPANDEAIETCNYYKKENQERKEENGRMYSI